MEDPDLQHLVRQAARGDSEACAAFAKKFLPVVYSMLRSRWRGKAIAAEVDDAAQDVFVDFFKRRGALSRVEDRGGGFGAFLHGVTTKVALRHERAQARRAWLRCHDQETLTHVAATDTSPVRAWERAWATRRLDDAFALLARRASAKGRDALLRIELLRLGFTEGLRPREIAARMGVEPIRVHRQGQLAREEFRHAWCEVQGLLRASAGHIAEQWRYFLQVFRRKPAHPAAALPSPLGRR